MYVRFVISDDGQRLVVNGCMEEHDHEEVEDPDPLGNEPVSANSGNAKEICMGAGRNSLLGLLPYIVELTSVQ